MPRHCTICDRDDRHAIDQALVQGEAFRNVSQRCSVSTAAIFRHYHAHIPQHLRQAHTAQEVSQADNLLAKVVALEADAKRLQSLAEDAGDLKTALHAIRELVRIIELQARLVGELNDSPTVNVLVTPEWTTLRAQLFQTLLPFPDARAAIADVLIESNGHASNTITRQ
jgi:hypothetical protein